MINDRVRVLVAAGNFHKAAVSAMILAAQQELKAMIPNHECVVVEVPGAWELPLVIKRWCDKAEIDVVVTLGAIEKGHTGHGVAIANAVLPALMQISLSSNIPVSLGIIGPDATVSQIDERAESTAKNAVKGAVVLLKADPRS